MKVKVVGQEKRTNEGSKFSKIEATCTNTTMTLRYERTETRLELKQERLKSNKLDPKHSFFFDCAHLRFVIKREPL